MKLSLFYFLFIMLYMTNQSMAFDYGTNIAWAHDRYGTDLTSSFDLPFWQHAFEDVKKSQATVARVWLFEALEGLSSDFKKVDPALIENTKTLCRIAKKNGIKIYWTLFDGNDDQFQNHAFFKNVQIGINFSEGPLQELLNVLKECPNYAIDLINEPQGLVQWNDQRFFTGTAPMFNRWITKIKENISTLPVTMSSGHHSGGEDLNSIFFKSLNIDFYDLHFYGLAQQLKKPQVNKKIILGEFGPLEFYPTQFGTVSLWKWTLNFFDHPADCPLAVDVYLSLLKKSIQVGFEGAMPWRYHDQTSQSSVQNLFRNQGNPTQSQRSMDQHIGSLIPF